VNPSTEVPATAGQDRRRPLPWLIAAGVLAALFVVATVVLFVRPASDDVDVLVAGPPVDAVMVLGGGGNARITTAVDYVDLATTAGRPAPALLLSVPFGAPWVGCGDDPDRPAMEVACVTPSPFTTSGESLGLFGTMTDRGWDRVAVSTSTFHVTRARLLMDRCRDEFAPDVDLVYLDAGGDVSSARYWWQVAQEWVSLLAVPLEDACR
jgi:hypothetical protein